MVSNDGHSSHGVLTCHLHSAFQEDFFINIQTIETVLTTSIHTVIRKNSVDYHRSVSRGGLKKNILWWNQVGKCSVFTFGIK